MVRCLSFLLVAISFAPAHGRLTLEMYQAFLRAEDRGWAAPAFGRGELEVRSVEGTSVKSRFTLLSTLGRSADGYPLELFSIKYAYIKARFPIGGRNFRVTMGKSHLTWGIGSFFNAGNLLFGESGKISGLTKVVGELREETDWLMALHLPLGRFSFIETAFMFPQMYLDADPPAFPEIEGSKVGARVRTKLLDTTLELGYLYDGGEKAHRPALSLQGNLGPDLYGSVTTLIRGDGRTGGLRENLAFSFGTLWINPVRLCRSLLLRIEGMVRPSGRIPIELFPEIIVRADGISTLIFRGVLSPSDRSGLVVSSLSFNPYQGFHLFLLFSARFGKEPYSFGYMGRMGALIGMRFTH